MRRRRGKNKKRRNGNVQPKPLLPPPQPKLLWPLPIPSILSPGSKSLYSLQRYGATGISPVKFRQLSGAAEVFLWFPRVVYVIPSFPFDKILDFVSDASAVQNFLNVVNVRVFCWCNGLGAEPSILGGFFEQ